MDAATFRKLGHELVDWVADYRERLERLPVMSPARPGEIRARFPAEPPRTGGGLAEALARARRRRAAGDHALEPPVVLRLLPVATPATRRSSPTSSPPASASQGMSWQTSPAATEVEEVVMDWLRQMVGLLATPGRASSTTRRAPRRSCALLCAREKASGFSQNGAGLQGGEAPLVVYASSQGHSSIEKAALLAGFGTRQPAPRRHRRRARAARGPARSGDRRRPAPRAACRARSSPASARPGRRRSTRSPAMAELAERARPLAARRRGDGGHRDGAAGVPRALGRRRARPTAWSSTRTSGWASGFDFSAYYVRDPEHLIRVMSTNPSYLRTAQDGAGEELPRLAHPARAALPRAQAVVLPARRRASRGCRRGCAATSTNAQWLREQVDAAPSWERLAPVPLQTVCLRHVPQALAATSRRSRATTSSIARRVNESGAAYLTPSVLKGRQMIRVSIGAETTERRHVEAVWAALRSRRALSPPPSAGYRRPEITSRDLLVLAEVQVVGRHAREQPLADGERARHAVGVEPGDGRRPKQLSQRSLGPDSLEARPGRLVQERDGRELGAVARRHEPGARPRRAEGAEAAVDLADHDPVVAQARELRASGDEAHQRALARSRVAGEDDRGLPPAHARGVDQDASVVRQQAHHQDLVERVVERARQLARVLAAHPLDEWPTVDSHAGDGGGHSREPDAPARLVAKLEQQVRRVPEGAPGPPRLEGERQVQGFGTLVRDELDGALRPGRAPALPPAGTAGIGGRPGPREGPPAAPRRSGRRRSRA